MVARSHHGRLFEQLLAEHRQKLVNVVVGGVADHHYRELVGEIRGLDNALALSEQADRKLSGEE